MAETITILGEKEKFERALNNYYSLKKAYEESFESLKESLLENKALSWDERRKKMVKKCVNCGREGGTIFSIQPVQNNDPLFTYRILSAECGNPKKCNLNIKLNVGRFCLLPKIIEDLEKEKEMKKTEIIHLRNQAKFGYVSTEEAATTPLLDDETSVEDSLTFFLNEYKKKHNESNDDNKAKEQEISIWLDSFKKRIKLHRLNGGSMEELEILMREYKENYFVEKQKIMKSKYKNYSVIESHLHHADVPIIDLDYIYMVGQQIINDTFDNPGKSSKSKSKSNTRKRGEKNKSNKTKKVIVEENKDPYKILGIERKDNLKAIKKAYFLLARKFHPDKNKTMTKEEAMEAFTDVSNAYENLADTKKRAYYDDRGVYMPHNVSSDSNSLGGGGSGLNPFTLYNMFFNESTF